MTQRRTLADLGALVLRTREATIGGRRKASKLPGAPQSPTTWENVENGLEVQTLTYTRIEEVFGWPHGSIEAYLAGGPEPVAPQPESDLPPRLNEATYGQLLDALDKRDVRLPPRIDEASYDALIDELRRRHAADRDELARRLRPVLDNQETAESVRARGMIPGRPMRGEGEGQGSSDALGLEGGETARGQ